MMEMNFSIQGYMLRGNYEILSRIKKHSPNELMQRLFIFLVFALAISCQVIAGNASEESGHEAASQAQTESKGTEPVQSYNARAKVISITDDGALCTVSLRDNLHKGRGRFDVEEPILISGVPADLVDGDSWNGDVFYAGIYKYTAAGGILKTVRAFATTEDLALQMLALWERQHPDQSSATVDKGPPQNNPPFGLIWGEADTRIKKLLLGAKAQIVNTRIAGDEEILEVEGLIQQGLRKTIFVFKRRCLVAVDLYYESPDWNSAKYDDFLERVRERIDAKLGHGVFISPYTDDNIDPDSVLWGYIWKLAKNNIAELNLWSSASKGYHENGGDPVSIFEPIATSCPSPLTSTSTSQQPKVSSSLECGWTLMLPKCARTKIR